MLFILNIHLRLIPSGGAPHQDQFKENMATTHVIYGQNAWDMHTTSHGMKFYVQ